MPLGFENAHVMASARLVSRLSMWAVSGDPDTEHPCLGLCGHRGLASEA